VGSGPTKYKNMADRNIATPDPAHIFLTAISLYPQKIRQCLKEVHRENKNSISNLERAEHKNMAITASNPPLELTVTAIIRRFTRAY